MLAQSSTTQQYGRFNYWWLSHLRALLYAIGGLLQTPLATVVTLLVIGISMAFPTLLYVGLINLLKVNQDWQGTPTISLYLNQNAVQESTNTLLHNLRNNPQVQSVRYVSPEQGLKEFKETTHFGNVFTILDSNPLPPVIIVTPQKNADTPQELPALFAQLQQQPLVKFGQLDMTWVKRLYYIVNLGERITYILAALLGIGVILIIGNTIRLCMQRDRQEITVLRLIGASSGFIRRPLLYRGIFYAAMGAVIALAIVAGLLWWLSQPVAHLAASYQSTFAVTGMSWSLVGIVIGIAVLLGWAGAWMAVQRHLGVLP